MDKNEIEKRINLALQDYQAVKLIDITELSNERLHIELQLNDFDFILILQLGKWPQIEGDQASINYYKQIIEIAEIINS